jgi:UDP-2-acetamido-2,6-beta-L-arabino-hexul-4-ose reductase
LRRIGTDKIIEYHLNGTKPSFVDIPIFYTHNITNEGETDLTTIFWTNELFNPQNPDTYYEKVNLDNI